MLKTKLKKLFPFKKSRQGSSSMGNCAGSDSTPARKDRKAKSLAVAQGSNELVLKVLVEVNSLSSEDGALRWDSVLEGLVPLSVSSIQAKEVCKYRLEASGVDGRSFCTEIQFPGTRLRKSSANFIQWRDEENDAWGLNFTCESDANNFMELFSQFSSSPESKELHSSLLLSIPTPNPPTVSGGATLALDSVAAGTTPDLPSIATPDLNSIAPGTTPDLPSITTPDLQSITTPDLNSIVAVTTPDSPILTLDSIAAAATTPNPSTTPSLDSDTARTNHEKKLTDENTSNTDTPALSAGETQLDDDSQGCQTECSLGEEKKYKLSTFPTPVSPSVGNITSEGDISSESDQMELFQPSSPFQIKEEFILADIIEENEFEDVEVDSVMLKNGEQNPESHSLHSNFEEEVLDIEETEFDEEYTFGAAKDVLSESGNSGLPMLPISPPPGPLLSPELIDAAAEKTTHNLPPSVERYNPNIATGDNYYRHSIGGALDDVPPPLPVTQPPGKLISPRHSMFMDLADLATDFKPGQFDLSQLVLKMSQVSEVVENKLEGGEGAEGAEGSTTDDKPVIVESALETQSLKYDEVLTLVPPIQDSTDVDFDDDNPSISRQRLGSHHWKTFKPPKEFSDSGFQDTDIATDQGSKTNTSRSALASSKAPFATDNGNRVVQSQSIAIQTIDSSLTCTSDDQFTENSGSVGLKTFASSGSEHENSIRDKIDSSDSITNKKSAEVSTATALNMAQPIQPPEISFTSIIRKTGWLELKTVLVCKNRKVAMKSKRKWKKYWANLKRNVLFLYECEEQSALPELETVHSDLKLDLENSLAHAVHDHLKRDHLFCLSTSSGNTYYLQTTSQTEVEEWITCIHCAAAVASTQKDKDNSLPVLMSKVEDLNRQIEKETQLKNLTSLNLNAVSDSTAKSMATEKLVECSENLEAYKVEVYRIRCYIASLQGTELPNPHSLLGSVSKPTKSILGRIGIFSVASLHAIVSARHNFHSSTSSTSLHVLKTLKLKEKLTTRNPAGARSRKGSLDASSPYLSLSSLTWGKSQSSKVKSSSLPAGIRGSVSLRSFEISGPYPKLSPGNSSRQRKFSLEKESISSPDGTPGSKRSVEISGPYPLSMKSLVNLAAIAHTPLHSDQEDRTGYETEEGINGVFEETPSFLNVVTIRIPGRKEDGQAVQLTIRNDTTAEQLLATVSEKFKLNVANHFVRLKHTTKEGSTCFIPSSNDVIMEQQYTAIEICQKSLRTIHLVTTERQGRTFGLSLVPEWDANTEIDLQSVIVEEVEEGGVAETKGISRGDEVVLVNGKSVMELGWVEVERLLSGGEVDLTVQSCSVEAPLSHHFNSGIMDGLICPSPPSYYPKLSGEILENLVVPTPNKSDCGSSAHEEEGSELSQDQIEVLLKDSNEISKLLRRWKLHQTDEAASVPWTKEDRLRKSVSDLIETEADYVRLLNVLMERYFEPLRHETYLSQHEIENLIGDIVKIVQDQKAFLADLKKAWSLEATTGDSTSGTSLKHVVLNVAQVFLDHVEHFKQYSAFCASHLIVKRILTVGENESLTKFFRVRNPTTDPSLNVDSLLRKPIVRVSRYPLFLKAMLDHTPKDSEEGRCIKDVIERMGVVADHMNEMQRLCEMYWPLIYHLSNNSRLHEIGVSVRITDLEFHGEVTWLNPSIEGLSKGWKKGQGPRINMFVFRSSVVLICLEKKQKRKGVHEIQVEAEDTKYREILPTVQCTVSSLPDSDGVTNMWRLQHRRSGGHRINYFFRSKSTVDKSAATVSIQNSIQEQQKLYGSSPSTARAIAMIQRHVAIGIQQQQASPYQPPRVTSPTPSSLSVSTTGYATASDTDHD